MIPGLDVFKDYFRDYKDNYVLIGGSALDIILEDTAIKARVTKDLDIVLIAESMTPDFGRQFWRFIKNGGYVNIGKSDGVPQYYRFEKPRDEAFPYQIEILSRTGNVLIPEQQSIIPIPIGDSVSSLSAILLDEEYYSLLPTGKEIRNDIVILGPQYLIPFKAKAWLNLQNQKERGDHVNHHDLSKHMTDIIRLIAVLPGGIRCELSGNVISDMTEFIKRFDKSAVDPRSMGLKGVSIEDLISVFRAVYQSDI